MRWKGPTSAAHNSKGIGEPKYEAAKSDTNATCIDYRHTTIPAAICLRPYNGGTTTIGTTQAKSLANRSQIT